MVLLFLPVFLFLSGCCTEREKVSSGFSQGVNLAPFFTYTPENPVTGEKNICTFAGPLAEYKKEKVIENRNKEPDHREIFSLRPFFNFSCGKGKNRNTSADFFWPLSGKREINGNSYWWFFPCLYVSGGKSLYPDKEQYQFYCLPFFYSGRGRSGQTSFAIFPLYGNLKNAGIWKELEFFLFPLWIHGRREKGNVYSFLWPFMEYEKSQRLSKHRVLPFYAWKKTGSRRENLSLLFPFFNYGHSLEKGKEGEFALLIPLLGGYENWNGTEAFSLFWPFFNLRKSRASGGMVNISVLGPFFRYGYNLTDPARYEFSLFPFWGYAGRKDAYSMYILFPFYFSSRNRKDDRENFMQTFFPFFNIREKYTAAKTEQADSAGDQAWQIWPVYSRKRSGNAVIQKVPDIFPFAERNPAVRAWGDLLALYKAESNEKGLSFNILWGLGRSTESENYSELAVGPFYMHRIQKVPGKDKDIFLDIFFSMVRVAVKGKNSSVRLFWFLEI